MRVAIDLSRLKGTRWYEFVVRFVFGGLITVIAGAIAKEWGPAIGGLFLAFPAIFPASATLVEKRERQRKRRRGLHGEKRGIDAAAGDAAGAAIGSVGLLAFAAICWWFIPRYSPGLALAAATLTWSFLAGSIWFLRKRHCRLNGLVG